MRYASKVREFNENERLLETLVLERFLVKVAATRHDGRDDVSSHSSSLRHSGIWLQS